MTSPPVQTLLRELRDLSVPSHVQAAIIWRLIAAPCCIRDQRKKLGGYVKAGSSAKVIAVAEPLIKAFGTAQMKTARNGRLQFDLEDLLREAKHHHAEEERPSSETAG